MNVFVVARHFTIFDLTVILKQYLYYMMAQIRQTIELLTKTLNENGTCKVRAEVFRAAKFDQDDAVSFHGVFAIPPIN